MYILGLLAAISDTRLWNCAERALGKVPGGGQRGEMNISVFAKMKCAKALVKGAYRLAGVLSWSHLFSFPRPHGRNVPKQEASSKRTVGFNSSAFEAAHSSHDTPIVAGAWEDAVCLKESTAFGLFVHSPRG